MVTAYLRMMPAGSARSVGTTFAGLTVCHHAEQRMLGWKASTLLLNLQNARRCPARGKKRGKYVHSSSQSRRGGHVRSHTLELDMPDIDGDVRSLQLAWGAVFEVWS